MAVVRELAGFTCLVVEEDAPPLRTVGDITALVGEALGEGAAVIVVPVAALDASFFDLRSRVAGEVLQKAANYGLKFAVVGDVSEHTERSGAFHDLVVESTRSSGYFFATDLDALGTRLERIVR